MLRVNREESLRTSTQNFGCWRKKPKSTWLDCDHVYISHINIWVGSPSGAQGLDGVGNLGPRLWLRRLHRAARTSCSRLAAPTPAVNDVCLPASGKGTEGPCVLPYGG